MSSFHRIFDFIAGNSYKIFVLLLWTSSFPHLNIFVLGAKIPLSSIFLIVSIFFSVPKMILFLPRIKDLFVYLAGFFLLVLGCFLSIAINNIGLKHIIELILCLFIPIVVFFLSMEKPAFHRGILFCLFLNGVVIALIGLYRLQAGLSPWVEVVDHYATGFGTRNLDAFFITLAVPAGIILAAGHFKRPLARSIVIFLAAVCYLAIILTLSRGSILTASIAVLICVVFLGPLRKMTAVLLIIIAIVSLLSLGVSGAARRVAGNSLKRMSLLLETDVSRKDGARSSVPGRIELIRISARIIIDYPIAGVGLGGFSKIARKYDVRVSDAHNNYLMIWTEIGSIAFLGYICVAFFPLLFFRYYRVGQQQIIAQTSYILFLFIPLFTSIFTNFVTFFGYWVTYSAVISAINSIKYCKPDAR